MNAIYIFESPSESVLPLQVSQARFLLLLWCLWLCRAAARPKPKLHCNCSCMCTISCSFFLSWCACWWSRWVMWDIRRCTCNIYNVKCRWRHMAVDIQLYLWGNNCQQPLNRRLGQPHSQSGRVGEEINPAHSTVAILSTVSFLHISTQKTDHVTSYM